VEIYLSANEVNVIRAWADKNIHGGHWGDGDFTIPEETIILRKLSNIVNGKVQLNDNEAKIILVWSESSLGIHNMEEESVIKKMKLLVDGGE